MSMYVDLPRDVYKLYRDIDIVCRIGPLERPILMATLIRLSFLLPVIIRVLGPAVASNISTYFQQDVHHHWSTALRRPSHAISG